MRDCPRDRAFETVKSGYDQLAGLYTEEREDSTTGGRWRHSPLSFLKTLESSTSDAGQGPDCGAFVEMYDLSC
jgi:hypothetical protein